MKRQRSSRPERNKQIERSRPPRRQVKIKRGEVLPDFDSLFEPDDDAFAHLEYTGDMETDTEMEVGEAYLAIKEEKKRRRETYRLIVDSEFWFAVCFQSRAQKDEFLEKAGWQELGDKYLDGLKVSMLMGVDISPIPLERRTPRKTPVLLRGREKIINEGGDS